MSIEEALRRVQAERDAFVESLVAGIDSGFCPACGDELAEPYSECDECGWERPE